MSQATATPAVETKKERKTLPPINRIHPTPEALEAARKDATEKGYQASNVRKWEVEGSNGKKFLVLASTNVAAAGLVATQLGIKVTEIDPAVRGAAMLLTPEKMASRLLGGGIAGLDEETKKQLLAALQGSNGSHKGKK